MTVSSCPVIALVAIYNHNVKVYFSLSGRFEILWQVSFELGPQKEILTSLSYCCTIKIRTEMFSMQEHRKKLGCRWSRVIFHLIRCFCWASSLAAGIEL